MNKHLIAAVLIAASAVATGSAFAASSSPAPNTDPTAGAPALERGVNIQMIAVDQGDAGRSARAFGGTADTTSESGARLAPLNPIASRFESLYSHH